MNNVYFKFMSVININCYKTIKDREFCNSLPYSNIVQPFISGNTEKITISEIATTQKVNELEKKVFKEILEFITNYIMEE